MSEADAKTRLVEWTNRVNDLTAEKKRITDLLNERMKTATKRRDVLAQALEAGDEQILFDALGMFWPDEIKIGSRGDEWKDLFNEIGGKGHADQ